MWRPTDPAAGSRRNMPARGREVNNGFPPNLSQSAKFFRLCVSLAGRIG
jgi:hypothetical protein